jgi:hypothetical protein
VCLGIIHLFCKKKQTRWIGQGADKEKNEAGLAMRKDPQFFFLCIFLGRFPA